MHTLVDERVDGRKDAYIGGGMGGRMNTLVDERVDRRKNEYIGGRTGGWEEG